MCRMKDTLTRWGEHPVRKDAGTPEGRRRLERTLNTESRLGKASKGIMGRWEGR